MGIRALGIAAGVAALTVTGGAIAVSAANAAPAAVAAATPHWHVIDKVSSGVTGDFTAVVATGATTGWGFDGQGAASGPVAWKRNGASWTKVAYPKKANEEVVAAAAASASSVWAFDDSVFGTSSRVVRWNGHAWSVAKSFSAAVNGATVLSPSDVWVFGYPASPGIPGLGVWHYNGHAWTQVSRTLSGGSALTANSVWAYKGTSVDHWTGSKWTSTSVKGLLPAARKDHLNDPTVTGILALSATSVYAVGNGNTEDEGGPTVVLHYDGHKWSKLAGGQFGLGAGQQLATDGSGGLWLPMPGVDGEQSYLVHYAAGKLTKATLPVAATSISVGAIARIPGTRDLLAGGTTHAADNPGKNVAAVVLEYS